MHIAKLTTCAWVGGSVTCQTIDSPTWQDVEEAVRALNGSERNDLYLQPESDDAETYLCIGGGDGRYVASGCVNNERFPTWQDPGSPAEPQVTLTVGGQPGCYPANWILDLPMALHAARSYFEAGDFTDDKWVDP